MTTNPQNNKGEKKGSEQPETVEAAAAALRKQEKKGKPKGRRELAEKAKRREEGQKALRGTMAESPSKEELETQAAADLRKQEEKQKKAQIERIQRELSEAYRENEREAAIASGAMPSGNGEEPVPEKQSEMETGEAPGGPEPLIDKNLPSASSSETRPDQDRDQDQAA